ncbi:MAG: HEPN domain-containing protein [Thermovirgaceae bacterium]|nr:HEPN domain-containing protein [Thermovirgaceae bacterium]
MWPDGRVPGSPQDWLDRAKSDLALAGISLPEGAFLEDLCFHAQQAAEKALKAVYVGNGWSFRYTHDIGELLTGLQDRGIDIPSSVDESVILASFAWEARYPGPGEPVSEEEYLMALEYAAGVVGWAENEIKLNKAE